MPAKVLMISNHRKATHAVRPEAEMMIGLKRRGLDIEVMTPADSDYARRMTDEGIRIYDYLPARKFSPAAIRRIRGILRDGGHDIVYLFNNKAIVNGIFASLGLPVKVVTYRGQTGNISRRDPTCYLTHLSPRVDCIVCVSEAVRQSLLSEVSDPGKLVTIHKGHDLSWYAGIEAADRAALGVPGDAFLVTCVANFRPRKGVSVLIDAAALLPEDLPVHFVLAGRNMAGAEVRRRVARLPLAGNFHLFDHRDDVLEIVAASDATVLPATRREGLPKTVIESMAQGVPPIVTATGGSPELVVDGESGLVVPPGDAHALAGALMSLCEDRDRARRMGVAARDRLGAHFRVDDSVAAHERLFRDLVKD